MDFNQSLGSTEQWQIKDTTIDDKNSPINVVHDYLRVQIKCCSNRSIQY